MIGTSGTHGTLGEGNTQTSPRMKKCRKWCFTLNNYTTKEYGTIEQEVLALNCKYIIGKEKGENGTPHLQGFLEFKNPRTFNFLKKINKRFHIEKARGTTKQNYIYCSKEDNFISNIDLRTKEQIRKARILDAEYKNIIWKSWQKKIIDILQNDRPDTRKIYWFWENTGNIGKSYLCKYLALTRDVIICEGKKDNIFNQVKLSIEADKEPNIILCDIPRTSYDYINYGAIEQLKNGLIYSGKYEGGQCIFEIPHVIIFANSEPDKTALSMDRWEIINIR